MALEAIEPPRREPEISFRMKFKHQFSRPSAKSLVFDLEAFTSKLFEFFKQLLFSIGPECFPTTTNVFCSFLNLALHQQSPNAGTSY